MLLKILKQFKEARGPMDLLELSMRIGVERSALDGMLQQLVRQGKLRETNPSIDSCGDHCGSCTSCAQIKTSGLTGKVYELIV